MEYKQAIIVRKDLKIGAGKICVQVAHAAVQAADKSSFKKEWIDGGQKKIVVKVSNEKELLAVLQDAREAGLPTALIEDAGHTQIKPGTKTCVGIGPAPVDEIDKITGELRLL